MTSLQPSFNEIKASYNKNRPYEDPDFEATDYNVFHSRPPTDRPFVWRRPYELVDEPVLVDEGASEMDVVQGMLGNCWFLAGIASLTQIPELFQRVMPLDQGFGSNYCGAFHFNFWQGGEWVEVIIDDRLPTIYEQQLTFAHSKSRNEFWSALLEKAYAKLHGSFEALRAGQTREALEDFTGGLVESFDLGAEAPSNLFNIMMKAQARQSLMCCSINENPNATTDPKLDNGLVTGHAYTVTAVRKVKARTRSGIIEVELIRMRNPWGSEHEWRGAWGDKSPEWTLLSDLEKKEIGLTFDHNGEFWMSYRDFLVNLHRLEICMLSPRDDDGSKVEWNVSMHRSAWNTGTTAGGCRNFPDTFHWNPQFRVTLMDVDEDDDEDMCSLIVSLMQVGRRKLREELGPNYNLTIGFAIYTLEEDDMKKPRLDKDYFLRHASTARSNTFINSRSITNRFRLKPGTYCIVPSTFDANKEGNFLLRLYSEKAHPSDVNDENTRITRPLKPRITASESGEMDNKYKDVFDKLANGNKKIDAMALKRVMQLAFSKDIGDNDFNLETCRSLIAMFDDNATGKQEFAEFKQTLMTVTKCYSEFQKYDTDQSGNMDMFELRDALATLGVVLSLRCLTAVTHRYSNDNIRVDFDDFLQIYTRVVGLIEMFEKKAGRRDRAIFSIDEFIEGAAAI